MLEHVCAVATEAGRAILEHYRTGLMPRLKADSSPVTDADMAAHDVIAKGLESTGIPVLSEEAVVPYEQRWRWKELWLVDPLDGTREFLAGTDEFAVNIAMVRLGIPVLGVIYAPVSHTLYAAEAGKGAWREVHGKRVSLPVQKCEGLKFAASRFHPSRLTEVLAKRCGATIEVAGAALKFGRLAEGTLNVYPRFVPSSEWDIAAGHAILRESGGGMRDLLTGKEPAYNKPALENSHFLAFGAGVDPDELMALTTSEGSAPAP